MTENPDELPNLPRDCLFIADNFEYTGWLYVQDEDLREHGYKNPTTFDIVKIGGWHYELQAYLKRVDCWWVQLAAVNVEAMEEWVVGKELSALSPEISEESAPDPPDMANPMSPSQENKRTRSQSRSNTWGGWRF